MVEMKVILISLKNVDQFFFSMLFYSDIQYKMSPLNLKKHLLLFFPTTKEIRTDKCIESFNIV